MFTIEPLRASDRTAAFECVVAFLPADERAGRLDHCLHLLDVGKLDARGIFVARAEEAILAVQVCIPLPGASCLFWLPAVNADHPPSVTDPIAESLVRAGLSWSRSVGCKIAQAFVQSVEMESARPLLGAGFQRMTRMHQLQHDLLDLPTAVPAGLRFETFGPKVSAAFAATLERTYIGTLDCPELDGVRSTDEILAGHQNEGRFDPNCWWLTYVGDEPIGVMMLSELEEGAGWELSYLGIVPEQRRRGFGRGMLAHALQCAREQLARRLIVAVDGRNAPALLLYDAVGFVEYQCHEVLLQMLA